MCNKRLIPCLDVKGGRVVKGVKFGDLRDAGDPVAMAAEYEAAGADELVFLDISATVEGRKTMVNLVKQLAEHVSIPFTVGGGVKSIKDIGELLHSGAFSFSFSNISKVLDSPTASPIFSTHQTYPSSLIST